MALRQGLRAVKEIKEAMGSGGGGGNRFSIGDGETAVVRFFGDFESQEDPKIAARHFIKRLQKQQYRWCGGNAEAGQHAGCVYCHQKENGDKGVGGGDVALFALKDTRKYHKMDQEVMQQLPGMSKPKKTKYPTCLATKVKPCPFCKMGNQAIPQGFRYWELSVSFADQLVSQQNTIRDYCKCGARDEEGNGTVYPESFSCSHCGEAVDFDPLRGQPVVRCNACKQTLAPQEHLACTACTDPQRCDLQDFYFKVTRTGSMTDTTYNFEAIHPCKPPSEEELAEALAAKPDWEKLVQPEAAEIQAAALGVPCPWQTAGHGAGRYDEENDTPDDGTEEEAAPAPRMPVKRPGGPARAPAPKAPPAKLNGGPKPLLKIPKLRPTVTETDTIDYE